MTAEGAKSRPPRVLSFNTHIHGLPKTSKMREAITPEPFKIEQRRTPGFVDNCLENVIGYVKQVLVTSLTLNDVIKLVFI